MAFSSDMANLVANQLSRFIVLNRHQLAGQVANLDYWLAQTRNALDSIDGYPKRFTRLRDAQDRYLADHGTVEFKTNACYPAPPSKASSPKRVPHEALRDARRALTEAAYQFFIRCCNEGLISEARLRKICEDLDISIEASDLRRDPR